MLIKERIGFKVNDNKLISKLYIGERNLIN